jgi:hypothetical protein
MLPQPLKAPKSGPKDYDENDLEYLKKKKEEVGGWATSASITFGLRVWPLWPVMTCYFNL